MALSPGTRLGVYEVRACLGAGGMGEVYRAHDPRLGRDVALKVLRPEVAQDHARLERFRREARAVAALNHPHIVTLYSTEEVDGIRFLTMELVEGQPLDALIPSTGLAVARFLDLALPLADALTAAHHKQITHRDLKPGNVMVDVDGRVKVLDFGLARFGGGAAFAEHSMDATRPALTHDGTVVGTMPYMSPEQVEGKPLDARSDLFALGVIFYEMLAGRRPFRGSSSPALMTAILRDSPEPLPAVRADLPESLVRLIGRCLEKRPEDRVQTARDVFNELRHVQKQVESGTVQRAEAAPSAVSEESLRIAVLPFGVRGADQDAETLASGLTEDITAGLSRFPMLAVIAPQSARAFKDSPLDVRHIAERLGARYVLGGTVRKSASAVRIAAHLVDARSGAHLWSETYDLGLAGTDIFGIQDDVTDRTVATVADKAGVLVRSMGRAVRALPVDQLSARELSLRGCMFQARPVPADHLELRTALETRLARHADDPHLWADLANLYICEHSLFYNPQPDPLDRAMRAARRAVEIDPGNQEGWTWVALAAFFQKDRAGMEEASERAIRLNPRNSNALAWMAAILTHSGDHDRGCALMERAMSLNAAHPGWYHFAPFNRHFARGEFADALRAARRANMPEFMWMYFAIAAAAGQLGLDAEGKAAAEAMVALAPAFADEAHVREFVTRWYWEPDVIEALIDGVRRATGNVGVRDAAPSSGSVAIPASTLSPASATAEVSSQPWLAVVPFTSPSGDAEVAALAGGLTEEVTAGLSRFPYLSVVASHTARQLAGSTADARRLGAAVGARYLLDGVVRRGGSTLRTAVRLVDAHTATQLWSETYNHDLQAKDVLAVQDDLADHVVATVGDVHGVLLRSMAQAAEHGPIETLDVPALSMRYWTYHRQHSPGEHAALRDAFETLVEERPTLAAAWAALAHLYCHEYGFLFNQRPDPLGRARAALDRALEFDAIDQHGWEALTLTYFFLKDREGYQYALQRALALNPRNANTLAFVGTLTVHLGELDRGCALVERAMAINPDHPGWYHYAIANAHLARGDFEGALRSAKRINMPQHVWGHAIVATAAGELGRQSDAASALDTVYALAPALTKPEVLGEATRRWKWDDAFTARIVEGYRKALALWEGTAAPARSASAVVSSANSGTGAPAERGVLVAPFSAAQGDATAATLAHALTEDVTTGLSRFMHFRVVARDTPSPGSDPLPRARYRLEGAVRTAGEMARVSVRLIDSATGANLWADTFDRPLAAGTFAVQDEIASVVVATVGDTSGSLTRSMANALADRPIEELSVAQLVLRFYVYIEHFRPEEHARLRAALEQALAREPLSAEGWACMSRLYEQEHSQFLNPQPDSPGRQRRAAERALELDPRCQWAWTAMAAVHVFDRDPTALRAAVERAIALNPLDADATALCALFLGAAGDADRALELAARAAALKPQHPGWYHFPWFAVHYARGQYADALAHAKCLNMPHLPTTHMAAAAAAAEVGAAAEARTALEALARLNTSADDSGTARRLWDTWIWDAALVERLVAGLAKAAVLTGQVTSAPSVSPRSIPPVE